MNLIETRVTSASLIIFWLAIIWPGCGVNPQVLLPGRISENQVLLPNGWKLSPAGKQISVGDLPLNLDISPDGHYAIVTNNGAGEQSISVVDIQECQTIQTLRMSKSWLGIRFFNNGKRFAVSGGNDNKVFIFNFLDGKATLAESITVGKPWPDEKIWLGGLDIDDSQEKLYVTSHENNRCYIIDLTSRSVVSDLQLPTKPYTCLVSKIKPYVYISLWGNAAVAILEKQTGKIAKIISVGDHPNDLAESPDGRRLFVTNGNQNTVSVIDVETGQVTETLFTGLYPEFSEGSTPNSLSLSPDGHRLFIANADNNFITVMDISQPGETRSLGFIPSGWYPTCVRYDKTTKQIIVANGKGSISKPNPKGPNPYVKNPHEEYIGTLLTGTLSLIDDPSLPQLGEYSRMAYNNTPSATLPPDTISGQNPIPKGETEHSPIKHIFYIIKENRTYDQVFGDMKEGNGDPHLCLFDENITPNHHALARQFVLLDNFYCDAEVSADGHNWSMGAYATDYVEKSWPTMYGDRGGDYEYEGGFPIVYPSQGYLWDDCARHGISYRSYGEFVENGKNADDSSTALTTSLKGHIAPFYHGWDLDFSDVDRVKLWEKEFDRYERDGGLPQFQIIKLPNDHTAGTKKGALTPKAFVAQNDYALGLVVERISHSSFWKESAIFVIEDDAQNGPDHVDAHRTVALVISPHTKHGFVDHQLYSTSSMVRTMELILGLPPLSQYDASATPMFNSFTSGPNYTKYPVREPGVDIQQKNLADAYGQLRSDEMNFSSEDLVPDTELNEIIWKSIRGEKSAVPAPVRSAFVQSHEVH